MTEHDLITHTSTPATVESLAADFAALGLRAGMTVLVHSSLSSLGWVNGGAHSVILALERVLTPSGTLVMPAQSGDLSDPAYWQNPPVPEAWWGVIRDTMPAFDPDLTPTRNMGKIPETFRKQEGVLRSRHPQVSFAAWGANAAAVTDDHTLEYSLGEGSPLARLYELDAWVLLIGVGHSNNTSLHLAEYRADYPSKRVMKQGAPILVNGERQWVEFDDIDLDTDDFTLVGAAFEEKGSVRKGRAAGAACSFFPQRALVDFAVKWFGEHRQ
jgi:aminoglycoside 3-N-acetyltransferase